MFAPIRRRAGFSLLETLVVLAIIMILLTLLVPVLTRALRMAKRTAAGEDLRQDRIGEMADTIHDKDVRLAKQTPEWVVSEARSLFHFEVQGSQKAVYSRLLYRVNNDLEFRAYWYTLLNPENQELPKFTSGGKLIAHTPEGQRFDLEPMDADPGGPAHPTQWEFISTRLDETGRGDLGGNVFYADGRMVYVPYPREFPMTPQVAELSHRFYMEVIHE